MNDMDKYPPLAITNNPDWAILFNEKYINKIWPSLDKICNRNK